MNSKVKEATKILDKLRIDHRVDDNNNVYCLLGHGDEYLIEDIDSLIENKNMITILCNTNYKYGYNSGYNNGEEAGYNTGYSDGYGDAWWNISDDVY